MARRQSEIPSPGVQAPTVEQIRSFMPSISARQLRLGLVNAGISPTQVMAAIDAMPVGPERDRVQIEWEYATSFNRLHALIAVIGWRSA